MGRRVLLIDNDEAENEEITWILSQEGYTVRSSSSGDIDIDELLEFEPQLLILSIDVRKDTSADFVRQLKRNLHKKSIPLFIIADDARIENLPRADNLEFFPRPLNLDTLLNSVDEYLLAKVVPLYRIIGGMQL